MKMNIYTIAFPFNGDFYYCDIDANMFANYTAVHLMGDGMLDVSCENKQEFMHHFKDNNGDTYVASFAFKDVTKLNVYKTTCDDFDSQEYDEELIERDIPYIILKVVNDDKEIYNLNDYL